MSHTLTDEELFCLEGCRSYEQYFHMRQQFESCICPFCDYDRSKNRIVWENDMVKCWEVPQEFMRDTLKYHIIIIPTRHVRSEEDLFDDEILAIAKARRFLLRRYTLEGGVTVTRFGDMRLNAGTVPHLHFNIMVPNGTGEVRVPVFKNLTDRVMNQVRAMEFAKRYEAGEVPK